MLSVETPRDSPFPWGLRPASNSDTKPQGYPEGTAGLSVSYADKKHVLWEFMRGQFKGLEWTANTILRRSISQANLESTGIFPEVPFSKGFLAQAAHVVKSLHFEG